MVVAGAVAVKAHYAWIIVSHILSTQILLMLIIEIAMLCITQHACTKQNGRSQDASYATPHATTERGVNLRSVDAALRRAIPAFNQDVRAVQAWPAVRCEQSRGGCPWFCSTMHHHACILSLQSATVFHPGSVLYSGRI